MISKKKEMIFYEKEKKKHLEIKQRNGLGPQTQRYSLEPPLRQASVEP